MSWSNLFSFIQLVSKKSKGSNLINFDLRLKITTWGSHCIFLELFIKISSKKSLFLIRKKLQLSALKNFVATSGFQSPTDFFRIIKVVPIRMESVRFCTKSPPNNEWSDFVRNRIRLGQYGWSLQAAASAYHLKKKKNSVNEGVYCAVISCALRNSCCGAFKR